MTLDKCLLGGAAIVALTGALSLASTPGFAQTSTTQQQAQPAQPGSEATQPTSSQDGGLYGSQVNPPQYSTPAEKQQTKQLNDQSVTGTTTSPAVLNGEAPTTNNAVQVQPPQNQNMPQSDEPAPPPGPQSQGPQSSNEGLLHLAQNTPQNDAQQQYNEQQQQYQQQREQYQDQQERYQDQQHRYYRNLREYDQARWAYDYPHPIEYRYEGPRLQRLYLIAEPSQQLADVPIEGPNGMWVGRVRNVDINPGGQPLRIEVALNHRVSVWVNPSDFRYDPYDHILFTDLTRDDLWDMPGATVESGPM